MLEIMMQSIAIAGGVPVANGQTIMPPRKAPQKSKGMVRKQAGLTLAGISQKLAKWSDRLLRNNHAQPAAICRST